VRRMRCAWSVISADTLGLLWLIREDVEETEGRADRLKSI